MTYEEAHAAGMTMSEAANATGKSYDAVRTWAKRNGVRFKPHLRDGSVDWDRELDGMTDAEKVDYLTGALDEFFTPKPETYASLGLSLTPSEALLTNVLMQRRGNTVTRDALVFALAQAHRNPDDSAASDQLVRVYMCKIRRKFREAKAPYRIENDWGFGYRIVPC